MDPEALHIQEAVIEAGALVDWLETGRGDIEIVGAALIYLRDELCCLAEETASHEAADAACAMIEAIDRTLASPVVVRQATRAA